MLFLLREKEEIKRQNKVIQGTLLHDLKETLLPVAHPVGQTNEQFCFLIDKKGSGTHDKHPTGMKKPERGRKTKP